MREKIKSYNKIKSYAARPPLYFNSPLQEPNNFFFGLIYLLYMYMYMDKMQCNLGWHFTVKQTPSINQKLQSDNNVYMTINHPP